MKHPKTLEVAEYSLAAKETTDALVSDRSHALQAEGAHAHTGWMPHVREG